MNYIIESLNKFYNLPMDIRQKIGGVDSMLVVQDIEKKYGVDISFALILIAIGELNANDLSTYLQKKYFLSADDAYDIANEVTRKIFVQLFYDDNDKTNQSLLIAELNEGLFNLLKDQARASIFNNNVFKILVDDASFLERLGKSLLTNELIIGNDQILSSGRKVKPTVANWIKDFLTINGTDNFNDIDLIRYITDADNAKNLSKEDKSLLFKVLKTYANIAFFLENSEKKPISSLEFIPTSTTNNSDNDFLSDQADDKAILKNEADKDTVQSPANVSDLDYLQKILPNYNYNSLEYKAISQEIERLRKTKK